MSKMPAEAASLLAHLIRVEEWVKAGDPRAAPYLEANAVRVVGGNVEFHPVRFDAVRHEVENDQTA